MGVSPIESATFIAERRNLLDTPFYNDKHTYTIMYRQVFTVQRWIQGPGTLRSLGAIPWPDFFYDNDLHASG